MIAKTFAFKNGAAENVVETRLLIHRAGRERRRPSGKAWRSSGRPTARGNRTDARLAVAGGTASVSWNYEDPDPDVTATYVGSTASYAIPHANQCGNCHINDDKQPGDSPIGPKVRLLNRPMDYGSGAREPAPALDRRRACSPARRRSTVDAAKIATNVQRLPRFNVAGDAVQHPGDRAGPPRSDDGGRDRQGDARPRLARVELRPLPQPRRPGAEHRRLLRRLPQGRHQLRHLQAADHRRQLVGRPRRSTSSRGSADDSILSFRIHSVDPGIAHAADRAQRRARREGVAIVDDWINTRRRRAVRERGV